VKLPLQLRSFEIADRSIDSEKRTLSFSFSSREPVRKWWGTEILSHDAGAIDMTRFNRQAVPFLLDHDRTRQIGKVISAELKGDRMYASVKLSRSAKAEETFQDILDGIRDNISVGYIPHEMKRQSTDDKGNDTYLITRWEPMEISSVSVPADSSVGIGRDSDQQYECRVLTEVAKIEPVSNQKSLDLMPESPVPTNQPANLSVSAAPQLVETHIPTQSFDDIRAAERTRISEIFALGKRFGFDSQAESFVRDGKSTADFRAFVLDEQFRNAEKTMVSANPIGMNQKEIKRYSLVKAIREAADRDHGGLKGLEREASDALAKFLGREPSGFFVPDIALMPPDFAQRDLQASVAGAGGVTVQLTVEPSLIAFLRNKTVVGRAGAVMMGGLTSNISLPRQTGAGQAYWLAENAAVTAQSQTFDQVGLSPKRLAAWTNYSKQLVAQSSLDIENIVRDDLLSVIGIEQDHAALYGTGVGNNQPTGLLTYAANAAGAYNYALRSPDVVFGATATWPKVVSFEGNVEDSNVDLDDTAAYVTSPKVKAAWKTIPKAVNYPEYLWEVGDMVNSYKAFPTRQIANNIVIFGKWRDAIIATWSGLDMVVDPYSLAHQNLIRVIVNLLTDIQFRYVLSFCASTDAGNQ
jgi:HK97 family phage major capsid protein/HK97 family phage prohead protease